MYLPQLRAGYELSRYGQLSMLKGRVRTAGVKDEGDERRGMNTPVRVDHIVLMGGQKVRHGPSSPRCRHPCFVPGSTPKTISRLSLTHEQPQPLVILPPLPHGNVQWCIPILPIPNVDIARVVVENGVEGGGRGVDDARGVAGVSKATEPQDGVVSGQAKGEKVGAILTRSVELKRC